MPRTLLVNCYRRDAEKKMPRYRALCALNSDDVRDVTADELAPGFDLTGLDCVVISGAYWMLAHESPREKLAAFFRALELPTLGICFGHQLMASSFGAEVLSGDEFMEFNETVEILEAWPLFEGLGERTAMFESHKEYVSPESAVASGWKVMARSNTCPVEAMRHRVRPLYGVQFHPEHSGENGERLVENFYRNVVSASG